MKKLNKKIQDYFKWKNKDMVKAIIGCALSCFAINTFIVPNALYNGGILGISQLIRSLLIAKFNLDLGFDIAGIINLLINLPLFLIAYKMISKTFFRRTLICVILQTIFFTIIPVPDKVILDELLTSVLIGSILAGLGGGLTLSASGSGGGTDIIGIAISMRNRKYSVGKIGATINMFIYAICGLLYGIPTMIYSIIYAVIASLVVDKTHEQNIVSYAMIFTKKEPNKILKFIKEELDRDATVWEGVGGYDKSKTYVCYSAMSKYEVQRLDRHLKELDKDAFMIKNEGIGVEGNFKKYLSN